MAILRCIFGQLGATGGRGAFCRPPTWSARSCRSARPPPPARSQGASCPEAPPWVCCSRPPSANFYRFFFWGRFGSPTKIDYRRKRHPYSNLFTGGPSFLYRGGFKHDKQQKKTTRKMKRTSISSLLFGCGSKSGIQVLKEFVLLWVACFWFDFSHLSSTWWSTTLFCYELFLSFTEPWAMGQNLIAICFFGRGRVLSRPKSTGRFLRILIPRLQDRPSTWEFMHLCITCDRCDRKEMR